MWNHTLHTTVFTFADLMDTVTGEKCLSDFLVDYAYQEFAQENKKLYDETYEDSEAEIDIKGGDFVIEIYLPE